MNRCLNKDEAKTIVELGEAELHVARGGTALLPWLPPSFPIRNPVPSPFPEPYPAPIRPNVGPRPNPFVSAVRELGGSIAATILAL